MSNPGLLTSPDDLRKYDRSLDSRILTNETLVYYITNVSGGFVSFAFDGSTTYLMPGMTISILSTPDQLAEMADLSALITAGSVTISSNVPTAPAPGTIVASGKINADGSIVAGSRGILSVTPSTSSYYIVTVDLPTPPGLDGGYVVVVTPTDFVGPPYFYYWADQSTSTPGRVNVWFVNMTDGTSGNVAFYFALIRAK